jgi:hypothetical protein
VQTLSGHCNWSSALAWSCRLDEGDDNPLKYLCRILAFY